MALSTEKIIEELNELIRFDHDALGAYDEAIDGIKETPIRDQLVRFRADHQRHINDLSAVVTRFGGKPVSGPDLKGAIRKTLTKVAGLIGTEATLRAMKSNEEVLNKTYTHHTGLDFPNDVLGLLRRNLDDERRHLAYIEQCLNTRAWESTGAHP